MIEQGSCKDFSLSLHRSFSWIEGPDSYQAKHARHWPAAALKTLFQEPCLIVGVTFVGLLPSSRSRFCAHLEQVLYFVMEEWEASAMRPMMCALSAGACKV